MQKLLDIKDPAAMESGVFPSLAPNQAALWRESENILFIDGAAEKSTGVDQLHAVGGTIVAMAQAFVDGDQRAYFAKTDTVYKWDATDGELILRTGFSPLGQWSLATWGEWLLATNNVGKPQIWKNGAALTMIDWPNYPLDTAKIIRKLANRPLLFSGQEVHWPRATDIEYFTLPDPTGNAGNYTFRDLDSDIAAVEPFGEQLAFYTENKMGFVSFIGGTSVYGFKIRLEGIGSLSLNGVVPVGAKHYGMSRDGIWLTDGSGYTYIDPPAVNRYLDHYRDPALVRTVVGVHAKDKSMVQWFFDTIDVDPLTLLPIRRGLAFNYKSGGWQPLLMNVTAAAPQEAFFKPLVALGQFFGTYDTGNDLGPDPMPTRLLTAPFDAGAADNFKWWDMVEVRWTGTEEVEVRFGLHREEVFGESPDDEWLPWGPLERQNWIMRESVYLSMEIRSSALGVTYRIGGLAVHGTIAGLLQ